MHRATPPAAPRSLDLSASGHGGEDAPKEPGPPDPEAQGVPRYDSIPGDGQEEGTGPPGPADGAAGPGGEGEGGGGVVASVTPEMVVMAAAMLDASLDRVGVPCPKCKLSGGGPAGGPCWRCGLEPLPSMRAFAPHDLDPSAECWKLWAAFIDEKIGEQLAGIDPRWFIMGVPAAKLAARAGVAGWTWYKHPGEASRSSSGDAAPEGPADA